MPDGYGATVPVGRSSVPEGRAQPTRDDEPRRRETTRDDDPRRPETTRDDPRRRERERERARSYHKHAPTAASSAQLCLLCQQPEPYPRLTLYTVGSLQTTCLVRVSRRHSLQDMRCFLHFVTISPKAPRAEKHKKMAG
jgi:hypothetical protein